jgi:hypothetical protein
MSMGDFKVVLMEQADRGLRQVATAQLASFNVNEALRTLQEASRGNNHSCHKTPGQF